MSENYDGKPSPEVVSDACSSATPESPPQTKAPTTKSNALTRAGVDPKNVYSDTASGAKASRSQLDELLRTLRDSDTLKITRLDRLGDSVLHLVTLGAELRECSAGQPLIADPS